MLEAVLGSCRFDSYVPPVHPITHSVWYGVGCAHLAGPREPVFALAAASTPLRFVGTQSFAGADNGMAADPFCDSVPGITIVSMNPLIDFRMKLFNPRAVVIDLGINDIIAGDPAATVAANLSTTLDIVNGARAYKNFRIFLCPIIRSSTPAEDVVVQDVNSRIPGIIASKAFKDIVVHAPGMYSCIDPANMADAHHPNDAGATQYATYAWNNGLSACVAAARGLT